MFVMNKERFREALKASGYSSIDSLAKALGVHRNTIHYYLSGRGILPSPFQRLLTLLKLDIGQILVKQRENGSSPGREIAPIVDALHSEFPGTTMVLFGSRAQNRSHPYSDWDIGAFSRKGLAHALYRQMVLRKDDLAENLPTLIDLVNLNRANSSFLQNISAHWIFLTGQQQDWVELQRRTRP